MKYSILFFIFSFYQANQAMSLDTLTKALYDDQSFSQKPHDSNNASKQNISATISYSEISKIGFPMFFCTSVWQYVSRSTEIVHQPTTQNGGELKSFALYTYLFSQEKKLKTSNTTQDPHHDHITTKATKLYSTIAKIGFPLTGLILLLLLNESYNNAHDVNSSQQK